MSDIFKDTVYIGIFIFNPWRVEYKHAMGKKSPLHITIQFRPTKDEIEKAILDYPSKIAVNIIGYADNGKNEGLGVAPFTFCNVSNPHITISWSEDSTPKATGEMAFTDPIPDLYKNPMWTMGHIGFFQKDGTIVFLNEIKNSIK